MDDGVRIVTVDELIEDIALEVGARDANDEELAVTEAALQAERDEIPY